MEQRAGCYSYERVTPFVNMRINSPAASVLQWGEKHCQS